MDTGMIRKTPRPHHQRKGALLVHLLKKLPVMERGRIGRVGGEGERDVLKHHLGTVHFPKTLSKARKLEACTTETKL